MNGVQKYSGKMNFDGLTGILKKDVAKAQIASKIREGHGGALFLCDVDNMERINEQYGHLAGDECLEQVSQVLSYLIRPDDIYGRYGGDEFVIFMSDCGDMFQAQEICKRIEKRFRGSGGKREKKISISVTVVWTLWQPGDTCRKLFERVEKELEKQKTELSIRKEQRKKARYIKDVKMVRKELIEQIQKPGAYCQDYETFKSIYRFLERGIIRSGQKACVILLTIVDKQGRSLLPHEKDEMMQQLGGNIGVTLRIGDVYTKYSSSQYLLLVIDTTEGQADMIVDRIKAQFLAESEENNILIHHCYELQPAQIGVRAQ